MFSVFLGVLIAGSVGQANVDVHLVSLERFVKTVLIVIALYLTMNVLSINIAQAIQENFKHITGSVFVR